MERSLLSLPAKFAGLGMMNPVEECEKAYEQSKAFTKPLTKVIVQQDEEFEPSSMKKIQASILKRQPGPRRRWASLLIRPYPA